MTKFTSYQIKSISDELEGKVINGLVYDAKEDYFRLKIDGTTFLQFSFSEEVDELRKKLEIKLPSKDRIDSHDVDAFLDGAQYILDKLKGKENGSVR